MLALVVPPIFDDEADDDDDDDGVDVDVDVEEEDWDDVMALVRDGDVMTRHASHNWSKVARRCGVRSKSFLNIANESEPTTTSDGTYGRWIENTGVSGQWSMVSGVWEYE